MSRIKSVTAILAGVVLAGGLNAAAAADSYNLTLSGASPGGLWSRIGGGVDAAIAKAYPGSTVTYQTSKGGLANIPLVSAGSVPMGIATDGDLAAAKAGLPPFPSKVENIRILFRAYTAGARFQLTHLMLNPDFAAKHGVKTFQDIIDKKVPVRVAINRRGNMDSDVSRALMEEMGASIEDIEGWGGQVVYAASKEIVSLMSDRRVDLANFGVAFNHPRIREIAKAVTPLLLDVPEAVAAKVAAKYGGTVCKVKPGEYKWASNGANSVCVGALIIASSDMDDATAYAITKALVEQIGEFKDKSHRLIKKTATPQSLATGSVFPFHPGSEKYLREAGLLK